jgi:hypothetical protein
MNVIHRFKNVTRHQLNHPHSAFGGEGKHKEMTPTLLHCETPFQYHSHDDDKFVNCKLFEPVQLELVGDSAVSFEVNQNIEANRQRALAKRRRYYTEISNSNFLDSIETKQRIEANRQRALAKRRRNYTKISNINFLDSIEMKQRIEANRQRALAKRRRNYTKISNSNFLDSIETKQRIEANRQRALAKRRGGCAQINSSNLKRIEANKQRALAKRRGENVENNATLPNKPLEVKQIVEANRLRALAKKRRGCGELKALLQVSSDVKQVIEAKKQRALLLKKEKWIQAIHTPKPFVDTSLTDNRVVATSTQPLSIKTEIQDNKNKAMQRRTTSTMPLEQKL